MFSYYNSIGPFESILLVFGSFLLIFGLVNPKLLRSIYKIWMGFAFALGWVISRIILTILFYLILTPIGTLAKVFGKKFLNVNFNNKAKSYWMAKTITSKNLEKMY